MQFNFNPGSKQRTLVFQKIRHSFSSLKKFLATVFVILYLSSIAMWLIPSTYSNSVPRHIKNLCLFCGLWQNYAVFSPPRKINLDLAAFIQFADGTQEIWEFPRMEKLDLWSRVQNERYRKYGYDHLNSDRDAELRPDFAKYLAREKYSTKRKPETILLVRHWAKIPPPQRGIREKLPPHSNTFMFFAYDVCESDFK